MDDDHHRPRRRSTGRRVGVTAGAAMVVLVVAVVALVAVGRESHSTRVAVGPGPVRAGADPSPTEPASTGEDPREAAAQAEVRALSASVPVDPAWTATASAPLAILTHPADAPATDHLIDLTRFFTTPAAWDVVDAWLAAHPPPGLQSAGTGTTDDRTGPTSHTLTYAVPPLPPTIDHFQAVEITTAPRPGGDTALRVDAGVIWSPTRSAEQMVPTGVDTALITVTSSRSVLASQTVHRAAAVQALVDAVDHLPVYVGGASFGCPAQPGASFEITFTGAGGGPRASVTSGNCGPSIFTRGHGPALPLETEDLMEQEARVLGTTVQALDALAAPSVPKPLVSPTTSAH